VKPFFDGKAFTGGKRESDTHHLKNAAKEELPPGENGREVNCRRDFSEGFSIELDCK